MREVAVGGILLIAVFGLLAVVVPRSEPAPNVLGALLRAKGMEAFRVQHPPPE